MDINTRCRSKDTLGNCIPISSKCYGEEGKMQSRQSPVLKTGLFFCLLYQGIAYFWPFDSL